MTLDCKGRLPHKGPAVEAEKVGEQAKEIYGQQEQHVQRPCGGRKHGRCEKLDEGLAEEQRDRERLVHDEMERHMGPNYTGS